MPEYGHCPKCGGVLVRDKKKFPGCGDCGFVFYPTIKLTVSVILENEKEEILLLQRGHAPHVGYWNTPGGHVDPGETAERAVRRETKEETGLILKNLEYVGSHLDSYEDQGATYPLLALSFRGRIKSSARIKIGDDAVAFKYFPKNKVPWRKMCFKSDIAALRDYLKRKTTA